MSEEEKKITDDSKSKLQVSFSWFIRSLRDLGREIFSIYDDGTDIKGTVESIKKDIEFKGHNVWILIFSIFIASIGLNLNSGAVIIGAMLISPLMGPILGIGLSLGTNDLNTFGVSFKNLLVAVVLSVGTSFIYFKLVYFVGFTEPQSELINRTTPNILDVFIAIFGGLAGIIANSRKEKTNVVPGVAIATALMPPLCTAGFGLATGRYDFFFGAFYLFLLNSACIAITTLIVVRFMKFPLVQWVNSDNQKKVKYIIGLLMVMLISPSIYIFYGLIQKNVFNANSRHFIENEIETYKTPERSITTNYIYRERGDTSVIELFVTGTVLKDEVRDSLSILMVDYDLTHTELLLYQNQDFNERINEIAEKGNLIQAKVEEMRNSNLLLREQNEQLRIRNLQVIKAKKDSVSISSLAQELKLWNDGLESVAYARARTSDKDTVGVHTFITAWDDKSKRSFRRSSDKTLERVQRWLEYKLKAKNVEILIK